MSENKLKDPNCCGPGAKNLTGSCCNIQAVVPIDGRGQIVLPKEVRDKAGFRAGDKLALISHEANGAVCCISIIKIDQFAGAVSEILEPFFKGTSTEEKEAGKK